MKGLLLTEPALFKLQKGRECGLSRSQSKAGTRSSGAGSGDWLLLRAVGIATGGFYAGKKHILIE